MGLSKATVKSPFKSWSTETFSLKQLIQEHQLPQVVRIVDTSGAEAPSSVDLSAPLLLYKSYSSRKVHATSLELQKDGQYAEVGPGIVIPDSYTGKL